MSSQQVTDVFAKIRARLTETLEALPAIIGNEAVNYSLDAFSSESWDGKPWQKRKSKKDSNRALLVQSGRLKRSIRVISTTATSIRIGTDVPYAAVHNNGGQISKPERTESFKRNRYTKGPKSMYFGGLGAFKKGTTPGEGLTFRAHSFNMPQRQFLGNTRTFAVAMRKVVADELRKALR